MADLIILSSFHSIYGSGGGVFKVKTVPLSSWVPRSVTTLVALVTLIWPLIAWLLEYFYSFGPLQALGNHGSSILKCHLNQEHFQSKVISIWSRWPFLNLLVDLSLRKWQFRAHIIWERVIFVPCLPNPTTANNLHNMLVTAILNSIFNLCADKPQTESPTSSASHTV